MRAKPLKSDIILQRELAAFQVSDTLQGNKSDSASVGHQHGGTGSGQQIRPPVCPSDPWHGASSAAGLAPHAPGFHQFGTFFSLVWFGVPVFPGPPLEQADLSENEQLAFVSANR